MVMYNTKKKKEHQQQQQQATVHCPAYLPQPIHCATRRIRDFNVLCIPHHFTFHSLPHTHARAYSTSEAGNLRKSLNRNA